MKTLFDLAQKLERRKTSSRQLVEHCLANIEAPNGEGQTTYLAVYKERALAEADACDLARNEGRHTSPFSGIPVSIKDLFDIAGEVTTAGSRAMQDNPAAVHDATAVSRLRQAGFIIIGRTNMTEFAYSGLGINAHFGTPANPYDRNARNIPGGSSSGAAVSVSDEMAAAAIGTDTGGSTRIPAALCGLVGFKPTVGRIPIDGCVPLSSTLDSIGPIAQSVACCGLLDAVMAGDSNIEVTPYPEVGLRLGVVGGFAMEDLDHTVARAFNDSIERLGKRGVLVKSQSLPELEEFYAHNNRACIVSAEAFAYHKTLIDTHQDQYDPWVLDRIQSGSTFTATDYIDTIKRREDCQQKTAERLVGLDALILPTVPLAPRPISDMLANIEESKHINALNLRNTSIANTLNLPAISIPCHEPGESPAGFMVLGKSGHDRELLSIALSIESIIRKVF